MTSQKRARRWMRAPAARSGFRYAQRRLTVIRPTTRGLRLKSLRDIGDVLTDFDRIAGRAVARVPRGVCAGKLMIAEAPAPSLAFAAPAPRGADTS